jgi:outer membrane protein assembly factor BamB
MVALIGHNSSRLRGLAIASIALFVVLLLPIAPQLRSLPIHTTETASTGTWASYHRDDGHTGYDPTLPQATSANAGWTSATLDEQVYAEPLIYNGLVYVATLNNTVYALNQSTGTILWSHSLGTPQSSGWGCGNVSPQGILGTPVIDVAGGRVYVAAFFSDDTYHVEGLSLADGTVQLNTTLSISGFDWTIQQQRGALALHGGYVYVPFGGRDGDCGTYHGYLVAVPTNGGANLTAYQTAGSGNSIWGAGGPVVDDSTGNVFVSTGQGACALGQNDEVIRLSSTTVPQDYFTPYDWASICGGADQDLGSAGPLMISSSLMFMAGKGGHGYLLNPNALGGADGQIFPASNTQADVCLGRTSDATFGSFAYAAPFIYVSCNGDGLVALNTNTGTPSFSPCSSGCGAPDWVAGGGLWFGPPIVAGGAVWVVDSNSGTGLYAFNASTGAPIFHSASFGTHHFVTPAEAGGQVFVPAGDVIREFDMSFLSWTSLGGILASGPDASSWGASHTDAFVQGLDGQLYHDWFNGTTWQGFQPLGGSLNSDPSAVSWGTNRIDVFSRFPGGQLWHTWWDGARWNSWQPLGGSMASGPDASSWAANRLDVFYRGGDNQLWHTWWDGAKWNTPQPLGGVLSSDPTAVSWGLNRIDVFARFTDNQLWHTWWDGTRWNTWQPLGGLLIGGPDTASCASGHLDVFALGGDSALYQLGWSGSAWQPWKRLGGSWTSDPGAVCPPATSSVSLFERGTDNALWTSSVAGT